MLPVDPSPSAAPPPRRVPEPFLRAEISAFPLGSEESFRACLVELDPQLSSKTGLLWRACEDHLAPHTGWSLDRLVAARDLGWFGPNLRGGGKPVAMLAYLRALARSHLIPRAGVTGIEESTDLSALDAADHYRWLTLTLPEDLLLCALGVEPAPMRVDVDPPLLARRLLDLGVAEIHQHVGGSMDFPLLWASALAAIVSADVPENALNSPGAPLSGGQQLVRWLLVAGIARCVLAEHLIRKGDDLRAFVHDTFLYPKSNSARILWTPRRRATLAAVFDALASADDKHLPAIEALRDLYCDMHPTALTFVDAPLTSVDDAYERCDPIAVRLGLHGRNAGERWLLRQAFAYLDVDARPSGCVPGEAQQQVDGYFSLIFWQVVRIRCQYYRTVVQRPLTGGLQWFIRFYERIGTLRKPLDPILAQVSFKVAGGGHRIRALEMRTTLNDTPTAIGEWVLSFLQSWRRVLAETSGAMFEPEMGLIFHFVKTRDANRNWLNGLPKAFWSETLSEPVKQCEVDVARGRFVDYFDQQCRKARALSELIKAVPSCLWVIRGLDVATDELGVPTWVMAPLFRHLVDTSARACGLEPGLAPLRVTAHAGEDFRHLLEGMRRIYEQVHYVLGSGRGRLGHAIALGVEPRSWAESVGSVLMPAEERLWDLVWEWRLYARYRIQAEFVASAPAGRGEVLLNKVRELSDWIYGKRGYRIEELAEAHHVLHRFLVQPYSSIPAIDGGHDVFLRAARSIKWGSYQGRIHFPRRVGQILEAYLEDEATFMRGQRLIDVPVRADEVQALDAVQHALRRGVAQRGIVIEVNPSSNLLIGDLLDLRNHPILRLNPPLPEPGAPPPVAIALGSDDPLTFSTELLREYTLLHQAACAAGYQERVVHEWLESIRRTGMDARFTLAWQPSAKKKVDILIETMGRYLHQRGQC
jgi:hypothetical protein